MRKNVGSGTLAAKKRLKYNYGRGISKKIVFKAEELAFVDRI